jgi:CSLREA domain-containing protein/uncharacterized repeat protein (TIGR01451 family)
MRDGRHVRKAVFDSALRTIAVAVTASALAGPALAAGPFTVNTTVDTHDATPGNAVCADSGGQCSLRAAIEEASASGGTTTINLPAGTYALSLGDLIVGTQANTTITINGAGQLATTITQTQTGRMVFLVNYNVDSNVVFTLDGVTVTGGSENENDPDGFGGNGGAILAGGSATAPGNALTITNVTFSGNYCSPVSNAGCAGGAIEMTGGGDLTVANSTFSNNAASKNSGTGFGGAINFDNGAHPGNVSITNSTFTSNTARSGQGGALALAGGAGTTFAVTGNTFTGNAGGAASQGGAIYQPTGALTARYNRIVGNTAGSGGGIYAGNNAGTTADARDNWWGCNGGPGAAGCDVTFPAINSTPPLASGQLAFDPWIVLAHAANPATVRINQSSTLTGGFLQDNHGAAIAAANLGAFVGAPITFHGPVLGTIPNPQPEGITASGTASATYNAGAVSGAGSAQATVDNATVTANLVVLQPPSVSKGFNPTAVAPGTPSTVTFGLTNANVVAIDAGFTDTLPAGLVVASPPGVANTCGGTVTAVAGAGSIAFSNAALATGSCAIQVNVDATVDGSFSNSVTIASTAAGTGNTATAGLTAVSPPAIAKAFGAGSVALGATTSLTFTLTNPNGATALTGLAFTDNLPAGLTVAPTPGVSNTCGGTVTAVAGASTASLSGASLAASGSCTVTLNVQGATAGVKNNSVQVTSTNAGTGNTANASLTVVGPPTFSKSFGATSIASSGSTSLSFTVGNPNATAMLTGVGFGDTLPSGLIVSTPNGLTGTCGGGTITATQGTGAVSLSGATLAGGGSCTFSVNVSATAAGVQNNLTTAVTSTEGGSGTTASASLTVVAPPSIAKAFNPAGITPGGTSTLTLTLTNPAANAVAASGVAVTDALPSGMVVATPSGLADSCGGTAAATAGLGSVSLSGGTIAAGGSCVVSVVVTAAQPGRYVNTTGAVSSTNGGTGNMATATLSVGAPDLTVSKSHTGAFVQGEAGAQFTITASNVGSAPTDGTPVTVTDSLPAGLAATAMAGSGWTCDVGTVSCTRSDVLAAGSSYPVITLTVNVAGDAPPSLTNTATVSGGGDATPANDTGSDVAAITTPIPLLGGPGLALLVLALAAAGVFALTRRV